jgi:hypothetical protein
VKYVLPNVK